MWRLGTWRGLVLGSVVAVLALLVARGSLRPAAPAYHPGLDRGVGPAGAGPPGRRSRAIGLLAAALGAAGFLLALVAAVLAWRPWRPR